MTARLGLATLLAAVVACGSAPSPAPRIARSRVIAAAPSEGRPPVAAVVRDGDPRGAIAVAVSTAGIAPQRGAAVGVALASLVEGRLADRGLADVRAVGGWDGWRLRALAGTPAEAARIAAAVVAAMLTPVAADEPAMAAVSSHLSALAQRPLADDALGEVARCTGEAYGTGGESTLNAAELESWRRAAHGVGRVAFATAGDQSIADGTAAALARGPAWPAAAPGVEPPWPSIDAPPVVYDASGEVAPAAARIVVTAWTAAPERAVASATSLGDRRGPLVSRLAALDPSARLRSVVAASHAGGGCVATTIDLDPRPPSPDLAARIAIAATLARQEVAVEVADAIVPADLASELATRASDPRESAERAAWWSLATARPGARADELRLQLAIGVAPPRNAVAAPAPGTGDEIRSALDRATLAWRSPAVEARTLVEKGQSEVWVLLASPCGTMAEANGDAGAGAAVATAAAALASRAAADAVVEPLVAADGIGILAHGPAHPDESPQRHARRLADLAARAFGADSVDTESLIRARTSMLARTADTEARVFGALGGVLAPGHPSWIQATGTSFGLGSITEEALLERMSALRSGPLRVAVVANTDPAQADAAVRAVDRWIVRRPGDARACPTAPAVAPPRAGTYTVGVTGGTASEALLALPVASDAPSLAAATWMAATLDGPGGLLERALGSSDAAPSLASEWNAALVGVPRSPALVVRLVASDASLDSAVAQTRALLDHLRQGALKAEDRARAASSLARASLSARLDSRGRVTQLWRSDPPAPVPSLDELRAFAAGALRDEALVIVAARPSRPPPASPSRARAAGRSRE